MILRFLKKLIFPNFCSCCHLFLDTSNIFCNYCSSLIKPIPSKILHISNYNINVYALSDYKYPIKSLILSKFNKNYVLSIQLAELIWDNEVIKKLDFDYIIPVPSHWTRLLRRGYNQAAVVSKRLARLSGKEYMPIVFRKKRTEYQIKLNIKDREKNVNNVFELKKLNKEFFTDKSLVIIDDLMTTGSTLKSMALLLSTLKPKKIDVIVGCRVI